MSSLERSLQLRLSRVNQLHDLLTGTSYRAKATVESLENLRGLVQRIDGVNQVCEQVNQEFQALAEQRKDAFQCGIGLVKSIRSLLFSSVFRPLFLEAHTLTLIKSLCEKIHHQKPFTAPDDLFNPTVQRELTLYENSYNALTTNYQLLLETIAQLVRQSPESLPALGQSQTLLSRVLGLNQQIQFKQQEALRYQEERLELFRELRRCVLAIIGRSRQLFGTQSEVYRTVLKCNIR